MDFAEGLIKVVDRTVEIPSVEIPSCENCLEGLGSKDWGQVLPLAPLRRPQGSQGLSVLSFKFCVQNSQLRI